MKPEPKLKPQRIPLRHLSCFWLGLLPVVILLWAWADSLRYDSSYTRTRDNEHCFRITLRKGCIGIERYWVTTNPGHEGEYVHLMTPDGPWGEWRRRPGEPSPGPWFPPATKKKHLKPVYDIHLIHSVIRIIPLWLVLAPCLPLWLALVWWQSRRAMRRQQRGAGDGSAEARRGAV